MEGRISDDRMRAGRQLAHTLRAYVSSPTPRLGWRTVRNSSLGLLSRTLYLGTADDVPDENFDASASALLQGSGRHQRGLACFGYAQSLAASRGWPFAWQLVEAPGVGHDHEKMFEHERCAQALFGPPTAAPTPSDR